MKNKVYIHYGHKHFNYDSFIPIKNQCFIKPIGGFWGSPVNTKYGWKEWATINNFCECKEDNCFRFVLKKNANVITIDKLENLFLLPVEDTHTNLPYIFLDFEKITNAGYDAIEVNITKDIRLYRALYGWDCDSILILNPDVVEEIE